MTMAPWQVIRVDLDKLRDQAPTLVSSIQEIMKKLEELQQAIFGDLVMPEGVMMYISTIYIYTIYICIYCAYIYIYYIVSYIVYIYTLCPPPIVFLEMDVFCWLSGFDGDKK